MRKLLFSIFILFLFPIVLFSQTIDIRIPDVGGSVGNADSLNNEAPAFYLNRVNHAGVDSTNDIHAFQDSVSANADVTTNTTHKTSDGSDHALIDQDVTSGSSPILDGANITGVTVDTATIALDSDSLNSKAPAFYVDTITVRTISGVEAFFLQPRGLFGTGAGWADEGFIGDVPVLLFAANSTERAIYTFYALSRVLLTDTNPVIAFIVYSTTAPVATTSDSVRWQLEARYIAETELATKTVDETILFTQGLPTLTANTRQPSLEFILDRTLMADQDVLLFTLSRIGGDDIYNADISIGQSGIILVTRNHNP